MRHPDEGCSGFSPSQGWCLQCSAVIRTIDMKWYGANDGPYCSEVCRREAGEVPFSQLDNDWPLFCDVLDRATDAFWEQALSNGVIYAPYSPLYVTRPL